MKMNDLAKKYNIVKSLYNWHHREKVSAISRCPLYRGFISFPKILIVRNIVEKQPWNRFKN